MAPFILNFSTRWR